MQSLTTSRGSGEPTWRRFFNNGRTLGIAGLLLSCLPVATMLATALWLLTEGWPYALLFAMLGTIVSAPIVPPIMVNLEAIRRGKPAVKRGRIGLVLGLVAVAYFCALLCISGPGVDAPG